MYEDTAPNSPISSPITSEQPLDRSQEAKLETWISSLLRYGVLVSSAIVLIGGVLYLMRHGAEAVDYRVFHGEPALYRSPIGIVQAVLEGHRRGIIQLGLLVLIATPILRVILSLITFLRWRDFTYATPKYRTKTVRLSRSHQHSFLG